MEISKFVLMMNDICNATNLEMEYVQYGYPYYTVTFSNGIIADIRRDLSYARLYYNNKEVSDIADFHIDAPDKNKIQKMLKIFNMQYKLSRIS